MDASLGQLDDNRQGTFKSTANTTVTGHATCTTDFDKSAGAVSCDTLNYVAVLNARPGFLTTTVSGTVKRVPETVVVNKAAQDAQWGAVAVGIVTATDANTKKTSTFQNIVFIQKDHTILEEARLLNDSPSASGLTSTWLIAPTKDAQGKVLLNKPAGNTGAQLSGESIILNLIQSADTTAQLAFPAKNSGLKLTEVKVPAPAAAPTVDDANETGDEGNSGADNDKAGANASAAPTSIVIPTTVGISATAAANLGAVGHVPQPTVRGAAASANKFLTASPRKAK